jgi:integrase
MTLPITRAVTGADPMLARSPFAGLDLCRAIGLTVATGAHRPTFDRDVWDFNAVTDLAAYMATPHKRWNLAAIRDPLWRIVAKEYLVALMLPTHDAVRGPAQCVPRRAHGAGVRQQAVRADPLVELAVRSGGDRAGASHRPPVRVLHRLPPDRPRQGRRGHREARRGQRGAQVVAGLAQYRDLFTTDCYSDGFRPFGGKAAVAVAGLKTPGENTTPPVPTHVLQPMLAAALYVVDTLGPHVVELTRNMKAERARLSQLPEPRSPGMGLLLHGIERRVAEGRPFSRIPVRVAPIKFAADESDPLREVSLREVATDAGYGHFRGEWLPALRPALERAVAHVGVEEPLGRDATPVARADGRGQTPWTLPLPERHARSLLDVVRTACLLVIAAATGMRSSELFELALGCRLPTEQKAPGLFRYRVAGKVIKHRGHGGETDERVVVGEVHQAVALAEQLLDEHTAPGTLLFGRTVFRNTYGTFRKWVNGPAGQRLGLAPIPEAPVELRMLRRSLAIELAYRPGGLLAAKVGLKHISVVTTEGYAGRPGGAQAKFLAEVGQEEQKRNLGLLLNEIDNYQHGIRPSGPHAQDLVEFFDTVDGKLTDEQRSAPNIIVNDQELRRMLAKRATTLHLGVANYCWFTDPSRALCLRLAGTLTADRPLIGMCDSARCPQATHHPCHRRVWEQSVASSTVFLGNLGRGQKAERTRLEAQLARAQRVLAEIDAASTPAGTDEEAN